jgi:membrane dipeptidase
MADDPILKPRIEAVPEVSPRAKKLFDEALVWDMLLPWIPSNNSPHIDRLLRRFHSVGVDFISLTIAADDDADTAIRHIARVRSDIRQRSDWLSLAGSVADIDASRRAGKLAVAFNFQGTEPFGASLELVQLFYDLGVRSALLAYNLRNRVADGCAEEAEAGLSRFGAGLVREMNRVGMLVDGSHSGHRSTMQAMELASRPFIFSHSNPHAVRPHYRSVRDDQIKACAATGGVIGINGVGYWVGDNDAPTDAIFRCLDYVVQLVGPQHAGLGFDYIWDIENLINYVRMAPIAWPPYKGEEMVKHNYAGPEQMVELTELMLHHGYDDDAVRGILGENWARVCSTTWG